MSIMISIDTILDAIRSYHVEADLDPVRQAYTYSQKVRQDQKKSGNDPSLTQIALNFLALCRRFNNNQLAHDFNL